jgi:diketogulonate reductase-like aldo/keto reductase
MKTIKLNDQVTLPLLGFGVWQLTGDDCYNSVVTALETGYRHIDTADRYGNHLEGQSHQSQRSKTRRIVYHYQNPATGLEQRNYSRQRSPLS